MLKHKHADVGVAVAIPGGLITPHCPRRRDQKLVHDFERYEGFFGPRQRPQADARGISRRLLGGVQSRHVRNKNFSAIINPPQATILAVGAAEPRIVVKDGTPAVATLMSVTLSCDHRAVDGVLGAELLEAFKDLIESPAGMLV